MEESLASYMIPGLAVVIVYFGFIGPRRRQWVRMRRVIAALQQQGWRVAAASPQMRAHSRAIYHWFPHRKPVKEARHPRYPGIRIAWTVNSGHASEAYEAIMRVAFVTGRPKRWALNSLGWRVNQRIEFHGSADGSVDAYHRLLQSASDQSRNIIGYLPTIAAAEGIVSLSASVMHTVPVPIGLLEFWASEIIRIERAHTASAPVGAAQRVAPGTPV